MGQLWHRHFRGNPLLPWVTGLGGSRPLRRAPLALAIALALLIMLLHVAWETCHWVVLADIQSVPVGVPYAARIWEVASTGATWSYTPGLLLKVLGVDARAPVIEQALYLLGLAAIPIWLAAWTWWRDRERGMLDQIAVTPITPEQIVGAKVLLWALLAVPFALLAGALQITQTLLVARWAPNNSALWGETLSRLRGWPAAIDMPRQEALEATLRVIPAVAVLHLVAAGILVCGVLFTAHLAVRDRPPWLCFLLGMGALVGATCLNLVVHPAFGDTLLGIVFISERHSEVERLLVLCFLAALWWSLAFALLRSLRMQVAQVFFSAH
jgi:hypothetical protein